jgi:hypothetical protein
MPILATLVRSRFLTAALAVVEPLSLASGRILPWHDSKPHYRVASLSEGSAPISATMAVARDGSDPWICRMRAQPAFEVAIQLNAEHLDLLSDHLPLTP